MHIAMHAKQNTFFVAIATFSLEKESGSDIHTATQKPELRHYGRPRWTQQHVKYQRRRYTPKSKKTK